MATATATPETLVRLRTDAPTQNPLSLLNMQPGARITRTYTLTNASNVRVSYVFTTRLSDGVAANPLWTDRTNGLQLRIRRGTAVVYDGPVDMGVRDMGILLSPGEADPLDYEVYLSPSATNSQQGLSITFDLQWTATGPV